jgi:hypothetical protein
MQKKNNSFEGLLVERLARAHKMGDSEDVIMQLRNQVQSLLKLNSSLKKNYEHVSLSLDAAESELFVANEQLSKLRKGSVSTQQEMKKDLKDLVDQGERSLVIVLQEKERLQREVEALRSVDTGSLTGLLQSARDEVASLKRSVSEHELARAQLIKECSQRTEVIRLAKKDAERRELAYQREADEWKHLEATLRHDVADGLRKLEANAKRAEQLDREQAVKWQELAKDADLRVNIAKKDAEVHLAHIMSQMEKDAETKLQMVSARVERDCERKVEQVRREEEAKWKVQCEFREKDFAARLRELADLSQRNESLLEARKADSEMAKAAEASFKRELSDALNRVFALQQEKELLKRSFEQKIENDAKRLDEVELAKRTLETSLKRDLAESLGRGEQVASRAHALEQDVKRALEHSKRQSEQEKKRWSELENSLKKDLADFMNREKNLEMEKRALEKEMQSEALKCTERLGEVESSKRLLEATLKKEMIELLKHGDTLVAQLLQSESARKEQAELNARQRRELEEKMEVTSMQRQDQFESAAKRQREMEHHFDVQLKRATDAAQAEQNTLLSTIGDLKRQLDAKKVVVEPKRQDGVDQGIQLRHELADALRGEEIAQRLVVVQQESSKIKAESVAKQRELDNCRLESKQVRDGMEGRVEALERCAREKDVVARRFDLEVHDLKKQLNEAQKRDQSAIQRLTLELQDVRSSKNALELKRLEESGGSEKDSVVRRLQNDLQSRSQELERALASVDRLQTELQEANRLRLRVEASDSTKERNLNAQMQSKPENDWMLQYTLQEANKLRQQAEDLSAREIEKNREKDVSIRKLESELRKFEEGERELQIELQETKGELKRGVERFDKEVDGSVRKLELELSEQANVCRRLQNELQESNGARAAAEEALKRGVERFDKEVDGSVRKLELELSEQANVCRRLQNELQESNRLRVLAENMTESLGNEIVKLKTLIVNYEVSIRELRADTQEERLGKEEAVAQLQRVAKKNEVNENSSRELNATVRLLQSDLQEARRLASEGNVSSVLKREVERCERANLQFEGQIRKLELDFEEQSQSHAVAMQRVTADLKEEQRDRKEAENATEMLKIEVARLESERRSVLSERNNRVAHLEQELKRLGTEVEEGRLVNDVVLPERTNWTMHLEQELATVKAELSHCRSSLAKAEKTCELTLEKMETDLPDAAGVHPSLIDVEDQVLNEERLEQIRAVQALETCQRELSETRLEFQRVKDLESNEKFQFFEEELARLQEDATQFEELKVANAKLVKEVHELQTQLGETKKHLGSALLRTKEAPLVSDLQHVVELQESEIAKLQRGERDRVFYGQNLQLRVKQLEEGIATVTEESKMWKRKFGEKEDESKSASKINEQLQSALSEANGILREVQQNCVVLEQHCEQGKDKHRQFQADLDATRLEVSNLRVERQSLLVAVEDERRGCESVKRERSELVAQLQKQNRETKNAELHSESVDRLLEKEVALLKSENEQKLATVQRLQLSLESAQREKMTLEADLTSKCDIMRLELESHMSELKREIDRLEIVLRSSEQRAETLMQEKTELMREIKVGKFANNDAILVVSDVSDLKDAVQQLERKCDNLKKENDKLKSERADLAGSLNSKLNEDALWLKDALKLSQRDLDALKREKLVLEDEFKSGVDAKSRQLSDLEQALKQSHLDVENLKEMLIEKENAVCSSREKGKELNERNFDELSSRKVWKQNNELQPDVELMMAKERSSERVDGLVHTLMEKEDVILKLQQQIDLLSSVNVSNTKEMDQLAARLSSMEAQSEVKKQKLVFFFFFSKTFFVSKGFVSFVNWFVLSNFISS